MPMPMPMPLDVRARLTRASIEAAAIEAASPTRGGALLARLLADAGAEAALLSDALAPQRVGSAVVAPPALPPAHALRGERPHLRLVR